LVEEDELVVISDVVLDGGVAKELTFVVMADTVDGRVLLTVDKGILDGIGRLGADITLGRI